MRYGIILILILVLCYSSEGFTLTGDEAMMKLNERFAGAGTMKGKLSISYQSGEIYSGTFMYMKPGKIYIKFTDPPGKIIIADGKRLWVYDSTTDVCGVQELETEEDADKPDSENPAKEIKPKLMGGIERFFRTYEARLLFDNPSQYTIELTNENRKYSEIKLILNSEFMLMSAIFKDKNGDGFVLKLSGVSIGERISPGLFNFNVPANAQVVKNPLDIR